MQIVAPALLLLVLTLLLATVCSQQADSSLPLRFWLDEYAFTPGETTLLKEEIEAAGPGKAIVSGETKRLRFAVKGYDALRSWDVYWTGRQQCERALTQVKPGQRVNCVPGIQSLTRKGRLIATLTEHYGEGAFELTPRSWLLPEQYWQWRLWAESHGNGPDQLWVLKQDVHRGKGVHVMKQREATQEARLFEWHEQHKHVVVQSYEQNQLQVHGRRFYVRLWVIVTGTTPLKVHLFDGGVVIFGSVNKKRTDVDMPADDEEYIVNLWTQDREASQPWSVHTFQEHINNVTGSTASFDRMWARMQKIIGYTYAAGLNAMRGATKTLGAPPGSSFEVFGVDMLVDTDFRPWLVEINAVPSLARKVVDCDDAASKECHHAKHAANAFDTEKVALMHGIFQLLQTPPGGDEKVHTDALAPHLHALAVAVQNRFIPILMVPDAAQYRHEQMHRQLQRHKRRRHQSGVIRAVSPVPHEDLQRELLADKSVKTDPIVEPVLVGHQPQADPNAFMMVLYSMGNAALHVWYWLPTSAEVLLWLSQYLPVADVLIMDYYRLKLGSMLVQPVVHEVPLDPLDQALHDAWVHRL